GPGLQADQAQHAERQHQHGDQHFDQANAALGVAKLAAQLHRPVSLVVVMRLLLPSVSVRMFSVASLVEQIVKECEAVSSPLLSTVPPTSAPPVRDSPSAPKTMLSLASVELTRSVLS